MDHSETVLVASRDECVYYTVCERLHVSFVWGLPYV